MWSINKIWNESVEQNEERPIVARDRIWASELGKPDLDIYLKLIGEKPSNDFDARARRKFEAGNLFEWIIRLVLMRCGIYKESQTYITNNDFGFQVSGKLDYIAGGKVDFTTAKKSIEELALPTLFTKASEKILEYFAKEYPNGLPEQGIEVKSTSSFGIEKVYFTGKALGGHDLQAFHYAYKTKLPFNVLYICRDDLRMAEIPIMPDDKELLAKYSAKIKSVADYYNAKKEPQKDSEIIFEKETERFTKNFGIEYSSYLTRNYKYETPEAYDEAVGDKIASWNRVITRIKDGKDMTDNNKEKIEEMKKYGFDIINLIKTNENK